MAKANVPGLKKSTGSVSFEKLIEGDYEFVVTKFETKNLYNNAPGCQYALTLKVEAGPPQADGKSPKGKIHWVNFDVKNEEHPDMTGKDVTDQIGIHELKSFLNAAGVDIKGDSFTIESAIGALVSARVTKTVSKTDSSKIYTNTRNWKPVE